MNKLAKAKFRPVVVSASALLAVGAFFLVGCGSSDTANRPDAVRGEPVDRNVASGGHEPAPAEAVAVIDSAPHFPGAKNDDSVSRGSAGGKIGAETFYWVTARPEDVASFYQTELPKSGWTIETPLKLEKTQPLLDGTSNQTASLTAVKAKYRLTVYVTEQPVKDPTRGTARLNIFAEPL